MPAAPAEIHVPISPTPGFLTRVRLLAASLRRYGGALADARVVVTVSRDAEPFDLAAALPWSAELGVEWRWIGADLFARHGIYATALGRMTHAFEAPFVILLDADTLVAGPLDDLLELGEHDAIGGVVAHVGPEVGFVDGITRTGAAFWHELHRSAGLAPTLLQCEHSSPSLSPDDPARACPAYFNLGVLAAPAATMARLGGVIFDELEAVNAYVTSWYRCQLAVTLAIARIGCAWSALPVNWNFPNDDAFWDGYPEERDDIRVLHYLRQGELDREADTGSPEGLARLLARRGLSPVHQLLQSRVAGAAATLGLPAHV
jgi:hypothetical protein